MQYTHARICSILEKAQFTLHEEVTIKELEESAWGIVLLLQQYPQVISDSLEQADPSIVAKYVLQLARTFNKYYAHTKILVEDEKLESRLVLCFAVATILKDGLKLLGIKTPKNM